MWISRISAKERVLKQALLGCTVLLFLQTPAAARYPASFTNRLDVIAFGSCNRHQQLQAYWHIIDANAPDLWIWLGDTVYNNTEDPSVMRRNYFRQLEVPEYLMFRKSTDIIGVWDDHDYGVDNGNKTFPAKSESQGHFLDFIEEPPNSERRSREGVYTHYDFGPPGQRVRLILLDTRSSADEPGDAADLLGDAQWEFLENAFCTSDADLVILGSSIQVLPLDHGFEKWSRYPESRRRLIELVRTTGITGLLIISGDRHLHEISILNYDQTDYPIIELTSSGLTHSFTIQKHERNRFRFGPMYNGTGFGLIRIDWNSRPRMVSLRIHDFSGGIQNRLDIPLKALQPSKDLDRPIEE